jgi:hypothetical protein
VPRAPSLALDSALLDDDPLRPELRAPSLDMEFDRTPVPQDLDDYDPVAEPLLPSRVVT